MELPFVIPLSIAGLGATLFLLERWVGLRRPKARLARRLLVNAAFTVLVLAVGAALVGPVAEWLIWWTGERRFGIARLPFLPAAGQAVVAFLLMDLSFYWWHLLNHRVPLLWRFHNVHHIDPDLDVTTSLRFHPVEIAVSTGFRVVQLSLIGVSPLAYLAYETAFQANTLFHHSNVRLPARLERWLNLVLVTPRMHGIHHSNVEHETNSNYSVVFSFWDRIHRSLRLNVAQEEIVIGVPAYLGPEDNTLKNALLMPFRKQREYWRTADGELRHVRTTAGPRPALSPSVRKGDEKTGV